MIGLLGSYTAPYVNPNSFYPSSLLGLAYPYLLIINILLLLYWIARWEKMAIVSVGIILAGYPFITTYYGLNGKSTPTTPYDLAVMSYNVRQMDVYGWTHQKNTPELLSDYINNSQDDVVCMLDFPNRESLFQKFPSYPFHYQYKDAALISRHEIVNKGIITFDKDYTSSCIFCDIVIHSDTLRVYGLHLESYRLGKNEKKLYQELTAGNSQNISRGVRTLLTRLTNANKNRAKQADIVKAHMNRSPYPVILCGDFNDTPLSYAYNTLAKNLKDSFIEKGHGLGNTYIGEFPSFRIDYILHSPTLETVAYTRDSVKYSDHYPIKSKIKIL